MDRIGSFFLDVANAKFCETLKFVHIQNTNQSTYCLFDLFHICKLVYVFIRMNTLINIKLN